MRASYRSAKAWIAETFAPLRPLYELWMKVVAAFSWLLARVVLTVAFVTIFLLYGVTLRLIGKDPMQRRLHDGASYWDDNTVSNTDISEFRRQY